MTETSVEDRVTQILISYGLEASEQYSRVFRGAVLSELDVEMVKIALIRVLGSEMLLEAIKRIASERVEMAMKVERAVTNDQLEFLAKEAATWKKRAMAHGCQEGGDDDCA